MSYFVDDRIAMDVVKDNRLPELATPAIVVWDEVMDFQGPQLDQEAIPLPQCPRLTWNASGAKG